MGREDTELAQTDFITTSQLPADRPHLIVDSGPEAGRVIPLDFVALKEAPLTLGRTEEANVVLRDERGLLSRRHFKFYLRPDDELLVIEDLGSKNGTWVNGQRIGGTFPIFPGDIISAGERGIRLLFIVPINDMRSPLLRVRDGKIMPEDPLPGIARLELLEYYIPDYYDDITRLRIGAFFRLTPQHAFNMGRSKEHDVCLMHRRISRDHAQIVWSNDGYVVVDQGAPNPVLILPNGSNKAFKLNVAYKLKDGDELLFDTVEEVEQVYNAAQVDDNGKLYNRFRFRAPRTPYIAPVIASEKETTRKGTIGLLRFSAKQTVLAQGASLLQLPANRQILIGRDEGNDLRLSDPRLSKPDVSSRHARLGFENGHYFITDLGSVNGTWVNNTKINWPTLLKSGDVVRIGNFFEFSFEEVEDSDLEKRGEQATSLKIGQPLVLELSATSDAADVATTKPVETKLDRTSSHPLRQVKPFDDLDSTTFELIAPYFKEVVYPKGQEIARAGSGRGAFYVVLDGTITIARQLPDKPEPLVLAEIGPGALYGERTIFANQPFVNRLTAGQDKLVRVFRLDESVYVRELDHNQTVRNFFEQQVATLSTTTWLSGTLLMRTLSVETLRNVAARMRYRAFKPGEMLAKQDENCEEFFLVVGGVAEAFTLNKNGKEQLISTLEEGDTFGDGIAAADQTYPMSVRARTPVDCYVLTRADFENVLARSGEPLAGLNILSGLPLGAVLNRIGPFASMPPQVVSQIAKSLKTKRFRKGQKIIRQRDDEADAFYIVRSGQVELSFETEAGERRVDDVLGPGQTFGEATLLGGSRKHEYTVTALEDCVILALYRNDIQKFKNFDLAEQIKRTLDKRYRPRRVKEACAIQENVEVDGRKTYMLSKADSSAFFELSEQGYFLWKLMDGNNSINDLVLAYFLQYFSMDLASVTNTVQRLQKAGFLEVPNVNEEYDANQQTGKRPLWQKIAGFLTRPPFVWNYQLKNIDGLISNIYKYFGWVLLTKTAKWAILAFSLIGLMLFGIAGATAPANSKGFGLIFQPAAASLFENGPVGLWWLWVLLFIMGSLFVHELGHALAVKSYNRRVIGGGINIFYYLIYTPYVDTNDMYSEPRTAPRIVVDLAGPFCNLLIGAICSVGALLSGGALRDAFFQLAAVSYTITFVNIVPVMQSDGYFALSNAVGIPNLRRKALVYARQRLTGKKISGKIEKRVRRVYFWYVLIIPFYLLLIMAQFLFWFKQLIGGLPDAASWVISVVVMLVFSIPLVLELLQASRNTEESENDD